MVRELLGDAWEPGLGGLRPATSDVTREIRPPLFSRRRWPRRPAGAAGVAFSPAAAPATPALAETSPQPTTPELAPADVVFEAAPTAEVTMEVNSEAVAAPTAEVVADLVAEAVADPVAEVVAAPGAEVVGAPRPPAATMPRHRGRPCRRRRPRRYAPRRVALPPSPAAHVILMTLARLDRGLARVARRRGRCA